MNHQAYNELEDRTDTNGQNECRMARERFLLYTMKEGIEWKLSLQLIPTHFYGTGKWYN